MGNIGTCGYIDSELPLDAHSANRGTVIFLSSVLSCFLSGALLPTCGGRSFDSDDDRMFAMTEEHFPQVVDAGFEQLKKVNQYEKEYWSARDLQPLLGYNHWRSFEKAIQKAVTSCEQSGNDPGHHFARARKPIAGGKGAVQEVATSFSW